MPTRPDDFPFLALQQTREPALVALFEQLCDRAKIYARLYDEFSDGIVRHREKREGKEFRFTKRQKKILQCLENEGEWVVRDMEVTVSKMDDVHLLAAVFLGERQQLALDEELLPGWHEDDKAAAESLLAHRRSNIDLIQETIQSFQRRDEVEAVIRLLGSLT